MSTHKCGNCGKTEEADVIPIGWEEYMIFYVEKIRRISCSAAAVFCKECASNGGVTIKYVPHQKGNE